MKRRFLVPETLQTSGMDCGPAALKSLLGGLGVAVNYERLREAVRTSADGTSIDVMEDLCLALGMDAAQEIAPVADALEVLARRAPAIVIVKGPGGVPHFVVFWRVVGGFVQVMDPARGRRWVSKTEFARELFVHEQPFDDDVFRQWFPSTAWRKVLDARLTRLELQAETTTLGADALTVTDAAARMVARVAAKASLSTAERQALFDGIRRRELAVESPLLPEWLSARGRDPEGGFVCRGCVLLAIARPGEARTAEMPAEDVALAATKEPLGDVRKVLGADGPTLFDVIARHVQPNVRRLAVLLAIVATLLASLAGAEFVFLRAAFNAGAFIALPQQRFVGMALYGGLVATMLVLEVVFGAGIVRLGRSLELRLRMALLQKLPRLPDHYFRSRPMSDVAHRSRGLSEVKPLPELFATIAKQSLDVLVTTIALALLHPRGIPFVVVALGFGLVVPYVGVGLRKPVESRVQAHASALGQVYLDALLGLVPLKTHGAKRAIRALQERYLVDWRIAADRSVRLFATTEAVQALGVLGAIVPLVLDYIATHDSQSALLLIAFWALRLPVEARLLSGTLQRVAPALSSASRLLEPLSATETPVANRDDAPTAPEDTAGDASTVNDGLALDVRDVSVVLGGQDVLAGVSFEVLAGEHVAIVGTSGAGKSTLLAVLLGLIEPARGSIRVGGCALAEYGVGRLRREAVWVDPTAQLWNRSVLHNLQFGNPRAARHPLASVLDRIDLTAVIERMPRGFATTLGESGARISGGEGQRIRLARALLRRGVRLVLLDEAFRGLDRRARRDASRAIRQHARRRTVIEVTHDVADTRDFDRILVVEDGGVVEHGAPRELLATPGSRYAALVAADEAVQGTVWGEAHWRRVTVEDGTIHEGAPGS